jgi:hypothetical protein
MATNDDDLCDRVERWHAAVEEGLSKKPPTAYQRALHGEYFPPRADGGLPYSLEDILFHLRENTELGIPDEDYAEAMRLPLAYVRELRATFGEVTGAAPPPHPCWKPRAKRMDK